MSFTKFTFTSDEAGASIGQVFDHNLATATGTVVLAGGGALTLAVGCLAAIDLVIVTGLVGGSLLVEGERRHRNFVKKSIDDNYDQGMQDIQADASNEADA